MQHRSCPAPAAIAAALCLSVCATGAGAQTLWFNGDADARATITNQTGPPDGIVFDDFIVPAGQVWNITDVFSDDAIGAGTVTTADWQIRSGVSAGNGGTLVGSGSGAATVTPTGGMIANAPIDVVKTAASVILGSGTYWLAVYPDGAFPSYITTTSGANAVGAPPGNDGNSYYTSAFFGFNFTPTSDPNVEGPGTWDYSLGVTGNLVGQATPEPSVFATLAGAAISGGAFLRRRRTHRRSKAAR